MLTSLVYRFSVQHAHPLGPWQAILGAVQSHHARWVAAQAPVAALSLKSLAQQTIPRIPLPVFRVLDLASGPRGEPGTTIAHALPLAAVHCTDSCSIAVADIPVASNGNARSDSASKNNRTAVGVDAEENDCSATSTERLSVRPIPIPAPPLNLSKSILDLTDLSSYESHSIDAVVCCYGYGLSTNLPQALAEAHRVLKPGGILVIASWERSAMLSIGRDVLAYVRSGGVFAVVDDEALFLPPVVEQIIELSGVGELEALLRTAGFVDDDGPQSQAQSSSDQAAGAVPVPQSEAIVTTRGMVYPYDLGKTSADQFDMGTILIRDELESLGALSGGSDSNANSNAGGWNSLAEEGFWMNIRKYIDMDDPQLQPNNGEQRVGARFLKDNVFKLTVSTKSSHIAAQS